MGRMKRYVWNLLIALDQGINAILGGDPDETLSSRMGKNLERCKLCRWVCRLLGKFDTEHCLKTIEEDRGKSWPKAPSKNSGDAA